MFADLESVLAEAPTSVVVAWVLAQLAIEEPAR